MTLRATAVAPKGQVPMAAVPAQALARCRALGTPCRQLLLMAAKIWQMVLPTAHGAPIGRLQTVLTTHPMKCPGRACPPRPALEVSACMAASCTEQMQPRLPAWLGTAVCRQTRAQKLSAQAHLPACQPMRWTSSAAGGGHRQGWRQIMNDDAWSTPSKAECAVLRGRQAVVDVSHQPTALQAS